MAGSKRERRAALDKALKGMHRALEARPLPRRLASLLDELDDGTPVERLTPRRARAG